MATGRAQRVLAISVVVTAVLYAVPFGHTLAWPLVLVSTLAHELGHGFAAALMGGKFEALRLNADASGVALWRGGFGRFATATVAGAGLIGPAVAAFVLLLLGRTTPRARSTLGVLGAALVLIALLLTRNAFGIVFILALAATLLLIAARAPRFAQTAVLLLAVQLALSVFSRGDYLFTNVALTSAGPMPSDVAVMSEALFLPYWLWGLLCGAVSVGLLVLGASLFFRR